MGELRRFRLGDFIETYKLEVFLEAGTSDGKGVREAQKYNFKKIISIEIIPEQASKMAEEFKNDPRVTIICGDVIKVLPDILPTIEENLLFYEDAHFPGADCGYGKHDDPCDDDTRLPAEIELNLIKSLRPKGKDVIIMDDIAIYADQGKYCWRDDIKPRKKFSSDRFFTEILANTHDSRILQEDTGYCVLTPK